MQVRLLCAMLLAMVAIATASLIDEHQPAFVQTGNELHYFSDAIHLHDNAGLVGHTIKSANSVDTISTLATPSISNHLHFNPANLRFGQHAIGVPQLRKVTVQNPTASVIRFDAISGSTVHFHCSFPERKTIDPGEETSFDVVFLPRHEGSIESALFIYSSLGTYTYAVTGVGVTNPYRIRPFVGARIPLNGSFESNLDIYNPHSSTLSVTEMYTSGGDLHLELPDMQMSTVASLWEIPPYQTKTLMKAKFIAARERNMTTAYIRIRTKLKNAVSDDTGMPPPRFDTIIVPVEVEVTQKRGIFATVDLIDFGLIRAGEISKSHNLSVISTLEKSVDIESLYVHPDRTDNGGLRLEFGSKPPIAIRSNARGQPGKPVLIAKMSLDTQLLKNGKNATLNKEPRIEKLYGKIVAESRGGNYKIAVPYIASVYFGELLHDPEETAFHVSLEPPISRVVSVTNNFPFGLVIWNISLPRIARESFAAKLLTNVVSLAPGETKPVFWLKYTSNRPDNFSTFCRLNSNVTKFDLPIVIFNGRLRISLYSIDQNQFDFGLMDAGDRRSIQFAITNENPVLITIKQLRNSLEAFSTLRLVGVEPGNQTVLANPPSFATDSTSSVDNWITGDDFIVPAKSFAVFEYSLVAPTDRINYRSNLIIETQYEKRSYPVSFTIEEGAIVSVPEKLTFSDAFPGKMSQQSLQVYSTFPRDMPLLRLTTLSHDPRIFFESFDASQPPIIKSSQLSYLGRIMFLPAASCLDDCYVGMPLHTTDGKWFTYGMQLPNNLAEIDSYLYQRMRKKWKALESEGKHIVNATVVVDSTEVKQLEVPAQGRLVWPRLMKHSVVQFPLTAVGNFTIVNLTLHNPSSHPVVVQLLPLTIYPDPEGVIHFFRDELDSPLTDPIEMNETLMFTLRDTELFNMKADSPVPRYREELEQILDMKIPRFTLSMLLQPSMKVRIRVGFLPSDYTLRSSLLLIRNNLTVMEPVVLYGRGAVVDMRIDNRPARGTQPLLFEIQANHLADCNNPKRIMHKLPTTLTVRRSFVVWNSGEVAFVVINITINGVSCENRGFQILNCTRFTLKPNENYTLEIAYTPDFTMDWNEATLQLYMHMNGTPWLYQLAASIPRHWLLQCHAALPRPQFEPLLYYGCVSALTFCLVCIVACAYIEGDKAITVSIRQQAISIRRTFDLNAVDINRPSQPPQSINAASQSRRVSINATSTARSTSGHVRYNEDARLLTKLFCKLSNVVLLVVSLVWSVRTDIPVKQKSRERKTKAPVTMSITVAKSTTTAANGKTGRSNTGVAAIPSTETMVSTSRKSSSTDENNSRLAVAMRSSVQQIVTTTTTAKHKKLKNSRNNQRMRIGVDVRPSGEIATQTSIDENVHPIYSSKHRRLSDPSLRIENRSLSPYYLSDSILDEVSATSHDVNDNNIDDSGMSLSEVLLMPFNKRHSSAEESECSAAPEWIDVASIVPSNYDEDFANLSLRTESLFSSIGDTSSIDDAISATAISAIGSPAKLLSTTTSSNGSRRQRRKVAATTSSSRSDSCSSVDASGSSSPSLFGQKQEHQSVRRIASSTPLLPPTSHNYQRTAAHRQRKATTAAAANRSSSTKDTAVPLIQMLQQERKMEIEKYRRMHPNKGDEEWPGFNLSLPALAENLWDVDFDPTVRPNKQNPAAAAWPRAPSAWTFVDESSSRNNTPTTSSDGSSTKPYKLNPKAPPFVSNLRTPNYHQQSTTTGSPISWQPFQEVIGDYRPLTTSPTNVIAETLGLSGSLFPSTATESTNIWNPTQIDPEVSWAEAILCDDDDDEK